MGRLKFKGWKKIYYVNTRQNKVSVTILLSEKVDSEQRKLSGIKRNIT